MAKGKEQEQTPTPAPPKKVVRVFPHSELDLNLMVTNSVWGKDEVPEELRTRLNQIQATQNEDGTAGQTIESLWGLLGYYTRDMRLGNLSGFNGEVGYCQYFLDLAGDFLQVGMIEPFVICLSRVATVLELSQSKGGFLRRRNSTFTSEQNISKEEPTKKSLFGGPGKKPGGVS